MIILHIGKIGVGKSYSCTWEIWTKLLKGIDCYCDWRIDFSEYYRKKERSIVWRIKKLFGFKPKLGKLYYYQDLADIYGIKNGQIYMDEAHRFLNARQWEKIPPDFIRKLSQSRKYQTDLNFITQHQNMIDVNIRRLCNEVVVYSKFWKFFFWHSYDGAWIDKLDDPILKPKAEGFKMTFFRLAFAKSYDTFHVFGEKFDPFQGEPMWSEEKYLEWKKDRKLINSKGNHIPLQDHQAEDEILDIKQIPVEPQNNGDLNISKERKVVRIYVKSG